jgi:hypothetical protein
MTEKEVEGSLVCERCGKKPIKNYQKLWVVWRVFGKTKKHTPYSRNCKVLDEQEPSGEDSLHLCDSCALEEFGTIEVS